MSKKAPNPTIEQLRDEWIDARFSFAALFGIILEQYGRLKLQITFSGDADRDAWFSSDSKPSEDEQSDNDPAPVNTKPMDHKDLRPQEPKSLSAHVAQILTLLHPKVKAVFGSSALYPILSTTAAAYGREGTSVEEKINGMSFPQAAQAWMIARRVFAVNHFKDLQRMLDLLMGEDKAAEAIMAAGHPLTFEEMTDKDREDVSNFCAAVFAKTEGTSEDSSKVQTMVTPDEALKEISELQASDKIVLLTSRVSKNFSNIGHNKIVTPIPVGSAKHPITVRANITGKNGEKSVALTHDDYMVMEAVGQIVQENGKGLIITPKQIYHKISGSDPSQFVSSQTIDKIVASMDKLLFTPASLDFAEQIEANTRLKAKRDKGELKGTIEGNIISGLHMKEYSAAYRGKTVKHSFLIYDMPMLYYYSQTVKQLVTLPVYLLSGSSQKANSTSKKSPQQKSAKQRVSLTEIGLQRYLLLKIEDFKQLREKQADENWKHRVYKSDYEYKLSFDKIASDIGYEISEKRKRMLREQTLEFLQSQVKLKNIKHCEYYTIGHKISGISITL